MADVGLKGHKHFLVWRDPGGLRRVQVFEEGEYGEALAAYDAAEKSIMALESQTAVTSRFPDGLGVEVCLFGADSILTLCRTHSSWLCPETIPNTIDALLHPASVPPGSEKGGER